MPLIPNPDPVIVPPIPGKEFAHLWLYNIIVHAASPQAGRICVETLPYDFDTQEIGSSEHLVTIATDKLWDAVAEVPEVATAMEAIFAALEPLREWVALKAEEAAQPEPEPEQ
jgi:hypothetical protein